MEVTGDVDVRTSGPRDMSRRHVRNSMFTYSLPPRLVEHDDVRHECYSINAN